MKKVFFAGAIAVFAVSCSKKETAADSSNMLAEPATTVVDSTKHIVDQGAAVAKTDSAAMAKPMTEDVKTETTKTEVKTDVKPMVEGTETTKTNTQTTTTTVKK